MNFAGVTAFLAGRALARANPTPLWTIEHSAGLRDEGRRWTVVDTITWEKSHAATLARAREAIASPVWPLRERDLVRVRDARGLVRLFGVAIVQPEGSYSPVGPGALYVQEAPPLDQIDGTIAQKQWLRPFGLDWERAWMNDARPDLLFALASECRTPLPVIVRALARCVRTSSVVEEHPPTREAVEQAEAWARGEASLQAMRGVQGLDSMSVGYCLVRVVPFSKALMADLWYLGQCLGALWVERTQDGWARVHREMCEYLREEIHLPDLLAALYRPRLDYGPAPYPAGGEATRGARQAR